MNPGKRKLTPKVVIIRAKKLGCGHSEAMLNLRGECTVCTKPERVIPFPAKPKPEKKYADYYPEARITPFKDRPNVIKLASSALMNRMKWDDSGYSLLVNGKWMPATLTQIMRAANAVLKELNDPKRPQITTNPNWVIL